MATTATPVMEADGVEVTATGILPEDAADGATVVHYTGTIEVIDADPYGAAGAYTLGGGADGGLDIGKGADGEMWVKLSLTVCAAGPEGVPVGLNIKDCGACVYCLDKPKCAPAIEPLLRRPRC